MQCATNTQNNTVRVREREREREKEDKYNTTKMQNEKNGIKFMSKKWCHKMHSHTHMKKKISFSNQLFSQSAKLAPTHQIFSMKKFLVNNL